MFIIVLRFMLWLHIYGRDDFTFKSHNSLSASRALRMNLTLSHDICLETRSFPSFSFVVSSSIVSVMILKISFKIQFDTISAPNRFARKYLATVWRGPSKLNSLHCKPFHCKNCRFSLRPFTHCSFTVLFTVTQGMQLITAVELERQ